MVNVLIIDPSYIVASGLASLLNQLKEVHQVKITDNGIDCLHIIQQLEADIIFINTAVLTSEQYNEFKQLISKDILVSYLLYSALPDDVSGNQFSIVQSKASMVDKLQEMVLEVTKNKSEEDQTEELSPREKSILKCVALGLTNKEIGEREYISTHTVISHRKNITRKLGIKTVSGLTVYAIINNIIQMNDIK
ncbi:response regulator transcription factor [Carboxylicivirga linearis]|uniref:Response regulator transcription factor n=1 Tax=Carboxylicivirga linearis TaxID=1628157 RepID=A0ABS5K264_9BACT|nr:LuxR C-terminal-related transcriptional regulator [Carboxylicivirga linearis]MBS2100601.1 response regulator transcription factor [Carboxylicivirga linearis]